MNSTAEFAQRISTGTANRPARGVEMGPPVSDATDWTKTVMAARCWAQQGDAYFGVTEVVDRLPAGVYRCNHSMQGIFVEKMRINIDDLLSLPDTATERLMAEFRQFWNLRENFDNRGFTFKRGMLLWGPPGSGKTSAIWQMTQEIVRQHEGIVVFVEQPDLATACLSLIRRIEPTRPLITVMEDLDTLVQRYGEHGYLALLDGETQIANVVHVATTNYPEMLDRRFVDRPSRFDTVMKVDMPSADARRAYLNAKEPSLDEVTLARWVQKTDGYSVAHLREVIIAVRCFEQSEDEVFQRMDAMRFDKLSSGSTGRAVGFGSNF
ncbi:MAG: ATP-binding protein [Parvibaculum sp.]|nr:ATP-binding protein [Parvibaculum sp.]